MTRPLSYRRGGYVSEFTRFIDAYLRDHPEAQTSQRLGWRIYWERPVNFDAWRLDPCGYGIAARLEGLNLSTER